jgi:hypothetical protein
MLSTLLLYPWVVKDPCDRPAAGRLAEVMPERAWKAYPWIASSRHRLEA